MKRKIFLKCFVSMTVTTSILMFVGCGVENNSEDKLPIVSEVSISEELEDFKNMNSQFLLDTEESYAVAEALCNLQDYRNMFIFDDDIMDMNAADNSLLAEIAASNAPHIDIYSETYKSVTDTQPIKAFINNQRNDGYAISLVSYGSDVRDTAKKLFGVKLQDGDALTIKYNSDLDIYYLPAEGGTMLKKYPVLTDYKKDGKTVTATVVILSYWPMDNSWEVADGLWNSGSDSTTQTVKEYLQNNLDDLDQYKYTFSEGKEGNLVLTGFEKL